MKNLVVANFLQNSIDADVNILGLKVYSVCGGFVYHEGVIRKTSVYDHKILGRLVQVWVEWFNHEGEDFYSEGHLTPYNPEQFQKWEGSSEKIGVYYSNEYYDENKY